MGKKQSLGFKWRGPVREEVYFFVYLSSQHILKITPLVKKSREQASVNVFAIFNSEIDQSDKPKILKFISKSVITLLA